MPKVDWTPENRSVGKPGLYHFEVEHAELRMGKASGYEYISLRLRCVDNRSVSVFDTLSFSPNAKNILQAKLSGLGMKDVEDVSPDDFVGRRVDAAVCIEEDQKGEERLVVDIRAKGSHAGYYPDLDNTRAKHRPINDLADDVPF